jgi:hypothetical protein
MEEEKKKIILKHPVVIKQEDGSEQVYKEIFIGRIKNKHLKLLPKNFVESNGKIPPDKLSKVISVIADIPVEVADEIDLEDTFSIAEVMDSFFGQSQPTGNNTSGS